VLFRSNAAATAQPSGKQNSFAAFNLPDLVLVEASVGNLAVSYANAFVKPVRASAGQSLMDVSVASLADYMARVGKTYNLDVKRAYTATSQYELPAAEALQSLADLGRWLAVRIEG
jgi:CRISPR system Cascade subunit CasC